MAMRSQTYRIAYLVKQAVCRMSDEEKLWDHFRSYTFARNATSIRLAVVDPDGVHETYYEIRVRRLWRATRISSC